MHLEKGIRQTLQKFGLDLTRYRSERTQEGRLARMLSAHGIEHVVDVGANSGQFAASLRRSGFVGRIDSIEPLSEAHTALMRASRADEHWHVAPRMALGAEQGELELNISRNSVSSSLLPMLPAHAAAAPSSSYVDAEIVKVRTFSGFVKELDLPPAPIFLKIDTQGYERQVLDGAKDSLHLVQGLMVELSLVPLYSNQQLSVELQSSIESMGFTLWGCWPTMFSPTTGRMLQTDCVFFRSAKE